MPFHRYDSGQQSPHESSGMHCEVCGHAALLEDTFHEFAEGLTDRLICQICGARRML